MTRNIQLDWIAQADARQVWEAAAMQRAASEPKICIALSIRRPAQRDWWHRLVCPLRAKPERSRLA